MTDDYTTSDAWADAARWMEHWRAAHPGDDRDDVDIYLSQDYRPDSPYWPNVNLLCHGAMDHAHHDGIH